MKPTSDERLRDPAYFVPRPTRSTRFWRTFLPWQLWRFVWINLKMLRIIHASHRH